MSFLLQNLPSLPTPSLKPTTATNPFPELEKDRLFDAFKSQTSHQPASKTVSMSTNSSSQRLSTFIEDALLGLDGQLSMHYERKRQYLSVRVDLFSSDRFLRLSNSRQILQFCKKLTKNNAESHAACISVDSYSGRVRLNLPMSPYVWGWLLKISPNQPVQVKFHTLYRSFFSFTLKKMEHILWVMLKGSAQIRPKRDQIGNLMLKDTEVMANVSWLKQMLMIDVIHADKKIEVEENSVREENKKQVSVDKLVKNRIDLEGHYLQSSKLYYISGLVSERVLSDDFSLPVLEEQAMKKELQMPALPPCNVPGDNYHILSHVFCHSMKPLEHFQPSKGGFSTITVAQMKLQYVYSSQDHEPMPVRNQHPMFKEIESPQRRPMDKQIITKVVALKTADPNNPQQVSRNTHQINVLKNIKNGINIFLPKYYIITNDKNPYSSSLVMDYIPFRTLRDFMRTETNISMCTKLVVMYSVGQALRYLRDYKIVHLDLKPTNVMMYCNFLIKMIDFGQAYHPKIRKEQHSPGFTIPYCPPQVFEQDKKDSFSAKSDTFSYGVILHELIYSSKPFFYWGNPYLYGQRMGEVIQKRMVVPEELELGGGVEMHRLLNMVIERCVRLKCEDRPFLDWIVLLMRRMVDVAQ